MRSWFQPILPGVDWKRQLPETAHVQAAYWLAVASALLAICGIAPTFEYGLAEAPAWAKVLWVAAAVQAIYAIWMASIPDWSTVSGGTWVAAASAMLYAAGVAVTLSSRADRVAPLGLSDLRNVAGGWCAASLLLWGLAAFAHGALAARWKCRQAFKARMAAAH